MAHLSDIESMTADEVEAYRIEHLTCTVVVAADGRKCEQAAVAHFTGRNGAEYAECVEHYIAPRTPELSEKVAHPATRSRSPFLLVAGNAIVGYANSTSDAVQKRARSLGARIVPNTSIEVGR